MPRVVSQLRRLFKRPSNQDFAPFKHWHYLNTQSPQELSEILFFAEQRHFFELVPDIKGQVVGVFTQRNTQNLVEKLMMKKAHQLVEIQLEKMPAQPNQGLVQIRSPLRPLPLRGQSFQVALLPFATRTVGSLFEGLPEISRSLINGGRFVLSIIHPVLEILIYNQNPASLARAQNSLSGYVAALKQNHLFVEDLREGIVDSDLKSFFYYQEGRSCYDEFVGLPLVLFLRAVKYQH